MRVEDHRLEDVRFIQSPDRGGIITPRFIVIHYTGGGPAEGSISWLTRPDDHYLSAHVVIGRDGDITQLVPFNLKAYHAGVSEWLGVKNLNSCSIGIELANYGFTQKEDEDNVYFLGRYKVPKENCLHAQHRNGGPLYWWEKFSDAQVNACAALCAALFGTYHSLTEIVGHDDIAPKRKVDPGPAWDMQTFKASVIALQATLSDDLAAPGSNTPHEGTNAAPLIVRAPFETLLQEVQSHIAAALRNHVEH